MDKPKKPRMITVTIGGVEFPAVSPRLIIGDHMDGRKPVYLQ
jgi:hypothetical protein